VPQENKQWQGATTFAGVAVAALEESLKSRDRSLDGTIVMLVGLNATARSIARALKERGAKLVFASPNRHEAAKFSRLFGGRHVLIEGVYNTLHDVAIICISAFLICSIAALIPAYFAARLDPVKALRYE